MQTRGIIKLVTLLAGFTVVGSAVLVPTRVNAAQTVEAPTSCTTGWSVSSANMRIGFTFTAPLGSNYLDRFAVPLAIDDTRAELNPVELTIAEWDVASGQAVGAPVFVTPALTPIQLRSGVDIGASLQPGQTYVAHLPSKGPNGDDMALCAGGVAFPDSRTVYFDSVGGLWDGTFWGTPGFSATFLLQPSVTSVTPEALPEETITIVGDGFDPVLTTEVTIDGIATAFTVVSATELTAVVPAAASVGLVPVQVTSDTLQSVVTGASQVLVLAPAAPPTPPVPPEPPVTSPATPPITVVPSESPAVVDPPAPAQSEPVQSEPAASEPVHRPTLAPTGVDPRLVMAAALATLTVIAGGIVGSVRRNRIRAHE